MMVGDAVGVVYVVLLLRSSYIGLDPGFLYINAAINILLSCVVIYYSVMGYIAMGRTAVEFFYLFFL